MRTKLGNLFILLGTALVLAALSLLLWNRWEDFQAGKDAGTALAQVAEQTGDGTADPYSTEMTEVLIDGYYYIGYLSLPTLGLELPVMSDWSYPQLRIAPCRYYGSTKTDNLVIAAHNYTRHFGNLQGLAVGDAVYFTDMDGVITTYQVAEVGILQPTDVEEMVGSDYALTLFTCTYGGKTRITVRCDRVQEAAR